MVALKCEPETGGRTGVRSVTAQSTKPHALYTDMSTRFCVVLVTITVTNRLIHLEATVLLPSDGSVRTSLTCGARDTLKDESHSSA